MAQAARPRLAWVCRPAKLGASLTWQGSARAATLSAQFANPAEAGASAGAVQTVVQYDTAFGWGADLAGFDLFTTTIINGIILQ